MYKHVRLLTLVVVVAMFFNSAVWATDINLEATTPSSTIGELLNQLGVEYSADSIIKAKISEEQTSAATINSLQTVVAVDEIIVCTPINNESVSVVCVNLYDEFNNIESTNVGLPTNNVSTYSTSFSDVTTTVDVNYPIYGQSAYKYVITYGADYSYSASLSGSSIYLYKPTSMFVRASSYASTTHDIDHIDIGCRVAGYEYSYSSSWTRVGINGYFIHEETVDDPVSGRTYTYSLTSEYYDQMDSNWIGVLRNNDFGSFLVTYIVVFDDGNEVANTNYVDK